MPLTGGTSLGPYQIVAPLGAGGMGEVYRARDARLARDVAVKVLPSAFADDVERLQRFEQEARAAAALNHPNILALFDIGRHEGAPYLVSELLEGTTLRDRVAAGALPVRKAVDYAVQIARGLAAAHEKGIVHRDLKPENVFVTTDGRIKILDFGLAKLTQPEVALAGVSDVPTTPPNTNPGVVLGTVGYMSPEQVRGTTTDQRSDIFACGVILYEMLSGRRPFRGETAMDSMTAILKEDPPSLPVAERHIPSALERIVERCLEKSPSARFQTATDLAFALDALSQGSGTADALSGAVVSKGPSRSWRVPALVTAVAATAALGAFGLAALYFRRDAVVAPEMRFDIPVVGLSSMNSTQAPLAVSPDGQRIAYVALTEGSTRIWIRPIGATNARSLAGTDDAAGLFWSPDNRFLAFFASGKLKKIDVTSGSVQTLADASATVAGTWNRDGVILFTAVGQDSPRLLTIVRVSASGGDATTAGVVPAEVDSTLAESNPRFLPDGRHFLYHVANLSNGTAGLTLYAGSLDATSTTRVMTFADTGPGFSPVWYTAPGYLLFLRNLTLMAQRFDADRLALSGEPVALAENVGAFSASDTGVLAYARAQAAPAGPAGAATPQRLTWFNRSGKQLGEVGAPSTYVNPTLSPDGRRLAVQTTESGNSDLWILDLAKGVPARLTFDPAIDAVPVWSPMGDRVAFASSRGTPITIPNRLYQKSANGAGADEPLLPGNPLEVHTPQDWSPDGRHIVFGKLLISRLTTSGELWALPLDGDRKPFPLVQSSNARVGAARFSPDGRWLAYGTNESGTYRVVVRPFPDPSKGTWQVPGPAGSEPKWRRDGRELFYLGMDGTIVAVPVTSEGDQPQFGQPAVLFKTGLQVPATPFSFFYDVTADGQRFLVNLPVASTAPATPTGAPAPPTPITVIVNWTSALVGK